MEERRSKNPDQIQGKRKMKDNDTITLVVKQEKDLYSVFSPDDEFHEYVKAYIRSKMMLNGYKKKTRLNVISDEPLDEEKFRSAASNWVKDEKTLFKRNEKKTYLTLASLLAFGSGMILLTLFLQKSITELEYSLMPIMGSLSLGRAAGILILDIPAIRARRYIIGQMEKKSTITFELRSSGSEPNCGIPPAD